ncbi:MAG: tRNA (guanosine(46)-N7)-methyltransferase TrmB [Prevotella sp.]|nr:tRNA (guanosine(46)-N7)-methyltransferase TrmB [Prevotella sp.]MCM1075062.1 tRNA (guanosine(46)-N7)-methyltransferase TrmB [Ruminococcus sp.]
MGKNKLKKFAEMEQFPCVLQYTFARLQQEGFPLRGSWGKEFFGNDNPIVLELGCGKGEYTVELARRFPGKNFIGIDIKGARIYTGARRVNDEKIPNAAFLRAGIENLEAFFAPSEVSEIWITFPDPQMQHVRRRLTGARFLNSYTKVLAVAGKVHLKTDSPFLYTFTSRLLSHNALPTDFNTSDLYNNRPADLPDYVTDIQTFYEQQWLGRGKQIKFLSFSLPAGQELTNPDESDIERDDYHAYPRGLARDPGLNLENLKS